MIARINSQGIKIKAASRILGTLAGHVWFSSNKGKKGREEWLKSILNQLRISTDFDSVWLSFVMAVAAELVHFPNLFFGLIQFVLNSESLSSYQKTLIKSSVNELAPRFIRILPNEFNDHRLGRKWKTEFKVHKYILRFTNK